MKNNSKPVQLSHRDRAMRRVIEYFAKSFKVAQVHSKCHPWVWHAYMYIPISMSASRTDARFPTT